MVDIKKAQELKTKLAAGVQAADIPLLLEVVCQLAGESKEVLEDFGGWEAALQFKEGNALNAWVEMKDDKFTTGTGDHPSPTNVIEFADDVAAGVFTGTIKAFDAYTVGKMKFSGGLTDMGRFSDLATVALSALDNLPAAPAKVATPAKSAPAAAAPAAASAPKPAKKGAKKAAKKGK